MKGTVRDTERYDRGQNWITVILALMVLVVALGIGVAGSYVTRRTDFTLPDPKPLLQPIVSDPVSAALFAGALSVLIVPLGIYIIYQLFFLKDR